MSKAQISMWEEKIVDSFAGGGGASTGIELATGRVVDIAINHDPDAILMHKTNHPHTVHYQTSVWDVDPLEVTGGSPVGLLWASPDCKHFSKAKGGKPVDKNIRGLAWIVLRWAGTVRPRVVILENVEEFQTWGPVRRGRPVKSKAGQTFKRFISQLEGLGYAAEWRELVAADYGAPTTRKRFFLIARCDGQPIVWPEPTLSLHFRHAGRNPGEIRPFRPAATPTQHHAAGGQGRGQVRGQVCKPVFGGGQPCWRVPGTGDCGPAPDHYSKAWVWGGKPDHGALDSDQHHQLHGPPSQ